MLLNEIKDLRVPTAPKVDLCRASLEVRLSTENKLNQGYALERLHLIETAYPISTAYSLNLSATNFPADMRGPRQQI